MSISAALNCLEAFASALVLGTSLYVLVTYIFLRSHSVARPWRSTFSAMSHELFWAALTSPLLPLYYFLGRRLAKGTGAPIVVVHGYMQNRVCFLSLARRLGRDGFGPVYGFNYAWFRPIKRSAAALADFVRKVCAETGHERAAVIGHSMGGLVALEYLLHHDGIRQVSKCITIASPHAGVLYRGPLLGAASRELRKGSDLLISLVQPLPVPVLSIASSHDNLAHPVAISSLLERGGTDAIVDGPGHLAILFDRRVADRIETFLSAPPSPEVAAQVDVVRVNV